MVHAIIIACYLIATVFLIIMNTFIGDIDNRDGERVRLGIGVGIAVTACIVGIIVGSALSNLKCAS